MTRKSRSKQQKDKKNVLKSKKKFNQSLGFITKAVSSKQASNRKKKKRKKSLLRDVLWSLLLSSFIFLIGISYFYSMEWVATVGMKPNFSKGEVLVIEKHREVKRFDTILFKGKDGGEHLSRVIGFPGEKIEYRDDNLLIDDLVITEKFLVEEINRTQKKGNEYTKDFIASAESPINVTKKRQTKELADAYYVMGDARSYALDSRELGWVYKENVKGVVSLKLWPLTQLKLY